MNKYLNSALLAKEDNGKGLLRQAIEAIRLRTRKEPLGIGEYYDYRIYHKSVTPLMLEDFIGWRQSINLDRQLNEDYSRVLANDKLLNYLILIAKKYPIPKPIATFTNTGRSIADEKVLMSLTDVIGFLEGAPYPFYVKPISAGYGRSVFGVEKKIGNLLKCMDGTEITLEEFLIPFSFPPYQGMLFQEPLISHPSIYKITGTHAVSCVRFICIVSQSGPEIYTAFWKIATGRNMKDNFSHGDYGNILGAINIENGVIYRSISKLGPAGECVSHPTTKMPIIGFSLPCWGEARELVVSACRHFPGLRLQNWDVALCPSGPVLLELNTESELNIPQAISGTGFITPQFRSILKSIEEEKQKYAIAVSSGHPR